MEKNNSEKKNNDGKRKSSTSDEEPPYKKICHGLVIQDILAPSEDRNNDFSAHSIQHVVDDGTSVLDLPEVSDETKNPPTNEQTQNINEKADSKEIIPEPDGDEPTQIETHQPDDEPIPPEPTSSIEEVAGIRLPNRTETLTDNPANDLPKDDSGKKIKWKCGNHFSDQGTNPIGNYAPPLLPSNNDPQSSSGPPVIRNKCQYAPKCYRKNSAHKVKYSHPGDSDYDTKDVRPECKYGVKCYRKDPNHKRGFKHTAPRATRVPTKVNPTPVQDYDDSDHSSFEESVDESEFDLSGFDESSDDGESDW